MTDSEPEKHQYDYLHDRSIEAWTWEFTRRNPAYPKAWARYACHPDREKTRQDSPIIAQKESVAAARFGLLFFVDPKKNQTPPALSGHRLIIPAY